VLQENLPDLPPKYLRMPYHSDGSPLTRCSCGDDEPAITAEPSDTLPAPMSEPPSMVASYEDWQQLWNNYSALGPTAREVLLRLSQRLAAGRRQYNDDFDTPRDWEFEAASEDLDACVYRTVAMIKRERDGRR
jgi:hypothetical protein